MPSGPSHAGNRQRRRREDADAPARDGGRRLAEISGLGLTPPAPYGDADRAGGFRRKLKPAGGRHGKPRDFGDDRAEPPMPQSFLETGQHRLLIGRLDIDHPVGRQPGLSERRREEVLAGDAPQHLAPCPRGNSCGKQRRRRAVDRAIAAAGHLMQGAERQSRPRADGGRSP